MVTCPECSHENCESEVDDRQSDRSGIGDETNIVLRCNCDRCGCQWTETETTTIEVTRHGNQYEDEEEN